MNAPHKGKLIVKVEEYYVPPRRLWFSNELIVEENFDYSRRLKKWTRGADSEAYTYDAQGQIASVLVGGHLNHTFWRGYVKNPVIEIIA